MSLRPFEENVSLYLDLVEGCSPETANPVQLYHAVSAAAMAELRPRWAKTPDKKRACYFSAEFLIGRMVESNLLNLSLSERCAKLFERHGISPDVFERIEDHALGNGGLGRLAACFLDSAATGGLPLDGYGIRYRYGIFSQTIENGFQKEFPDDWTHFGDPWSIRREDESVTVTFGDQSVRAVPYDMPVIGYGKDAAINTLRLWQAEPLVPFDFGQFNSQRYDEAVLERNRAEAISAVLYPNDDNDAGKRLRLKQQYFFTSASLQSILSSFSACHESDFSQLSNFIAIQLNDTHPVVAIPELLRILTQQYHLSFESALAYARDVFAYTNHTILSEALETWDVGLFSSVLPGVYPYVVMLQEALQQELCEKSIPPQEQSRYHIIADGRIHMARMAIYASHSTNGVAKIHTEILKSRALPEWYSLYPDRFQNKTNGITQRRWLKFCNPELSALITERIGDGWIYDLTQLKRLEGQIDESLCRAFLSVKAEKKRQLCRVLKEREGFDLSEHFLFDIQIKRLHEYKRQLLNALSILDLYYSLKSGDLSNWNPTVCLFGAKAAPGYRRAKGIIKLINEIAKKVNADGDTNDRLRVLFVSNYNVSYAQKLIPAADLSEQISTAGTEASGTGNMKFMLNGAVTIGTLDGANVEIVEQAGWENNYIFGATVEELEQMMPVYSPVTLYEANPRIRRAIDSLVDGSFSDDGTGLFRELYDSLLYGSHWHRPDHYYLLHDLIPYCDTRRRANRDFGDSVAFAAKCLHNIANSGVFSSDRTVNEYARDIWNIRPIH